MSKKTNPGWYFYSLERRLSRLVALDQRPTVEKADSMLGECGNVGVAGKYRG